MRIFIDGQEGTTGLKIYERFSNREDITPIKIDPEKRKDARARLSCMEEADISFLCLPDEASREIVSLADASGGKYRIIDTSTAFRTSSDWVYGMPELEIDRYEAIAKTDRLAVPGCHATGFILIAGALIRTGVCGSDYPFSCHSVTGYSGGGKKMIADYESRELAAPRQYGLAQAHKHLPEMQKFSGAEMPIAFNPIVSNFYSGMLVTVPLHAHLLRKKLSPRGLYEIFAEYYRDRPLIRVVEPGNESTDGYLPADKLAGRDDLELLFYGDAEKPMIAARFDNLGKGASGAAIQCMNIMLGLPENYGLILELI